MTEEVVEMPKHEQNGGAEAPPRTCDVPGCGRRHRSVRTYEIAFADGRVVADLCVQHAEPLRSLRTALTRGNVQLLPKRQMAVRGHSTDPVPPEGLPDDV